MKLIQLNVWQGRLIKDVVAFIKEEQPDILCAQEVLDCKGTIPVPNEMFESLARIKEAGDFPYVFFAPTFSAEAAGTIYSYGNAILSRHPLQDQRTIFTNGEYTALMTDKNYQNNTRNMQIARVVTDDAKQYTIVNHHAHWELSDLGSVMSIEKMEVVAEHLRDLPKPIIFAGDLNIRGASPAMAPINELLEDLTTSHHIATTLSRLSPISRTKSVPCDHVCISKDVHVVKYTASDVLVSDHLALVCEFSL
jgi:endonuclease/exonuclease/phosphatase family metal-dependent hydrolase